ncbi:hypothetical protein HaLaN_25800 [Haematococcus lacustris]|uniref:Protein kinase domain-containing protein n=1 Tax=Haematococcus lacustris TaxID=44745 RepID=A0A699ZZ64_HAELA|nr:hypothetical protein HaLaN_25800 [Haematococcus lacustris]
MGGCFSASRKPKDPPASFTEISHCIVTAEKRIALSIDYPDSWQTNGEPSSATVTLGASLLATSSDVHIQKQMQAFHSEQHRGLYKMWSELDLLADLHLDSVLGQGGFAVVMHGLWRGSTSVAVKLVATKAMRTGTVEDSQLSTVSSASTSQPVPALFEALLSRDLAHPNIIKWCVWLTLMGGQVEEEEEVKRVLRSMTGA